jgi:hypothetical protein
MNTRITRFALFTILLTSALSPLAFPSKSLSQIDRQTQAQESCLAAARKSVVTMQRDGVNPNDPATLRAIDQMCGTSLTLNPTSQPVLEETQDGAELPPPECVEELQHSDFCLGEPWETKAQ